LGCIALEGYFVFREGRLTARGDRRAEVLLQSAGKQFKVLNINDLGDAISLQMQRALCGCV